MMNNGKWIGLIIKLLLNSSRIMKCQRKNSIIAKIINTIKVVTTNWNLEIVQCFEKSKLNIFIIKWKLKY